MNVKIKHVEAEMFVQSSCMPCQLGEDIQKTEQVRAEQLISRMET